MGSCQPGASCHLHSGYRLDSLFRSDCCALTPSESEKSFGITDWYTCVSYDGGETYYSCDYVGSDGQDSYYAYDYPFDNQWAIAREAPGDCAYDPVSCQESAPQPFDEPRPAPDGGGDQIASDTVLSSQICGDTIHLDFEAEVASGIRKFCSGKVPNNNRLFHINLALESMHALGGICDTLATLGDSLLAHGRIRIYSLNSRPTPGEYRAGGFTAGIGVDGSLMGQQNIWTDFLYDSDHYTRRTLIESGPYSPGAYRGMVVRRDLQSSLAHELDHVAGRLDHLDPAGYLTINQIACGGLP